MLYFVGKFLVAM